MLSVAVDIKGINYSLLNKPDKELKDNLCEICTEIQKKPVLLHSPDTEIEYEELSIGGIEIKRCHHCGNVIEHRV